MENIENIEEIDCIKNDRDRNFGIVGLVTLYNPNVENSTRNIMLFAENVDELIIWNNSSLDKKVREQILPQLQDKNVRILWKEDGINHCIAPALNFTWHYAKEKGYDAILLMDQDSQWENFEPYRNKVEQMYTSGRIAVYTPYVNGVDDSLMMITSEIMQKRGFINSGTVIPVLILDKLNGADETFALDALDTDLSIRTKKEGFEILCLTDYRLNHSLGNPKTKWFGPFKVFTPDYNRYRTWSITRSHIICYRKHRSVMGAWDREFLYKEILLRKFVRIILAESDKVGRMKAFVKGIIEGCRYKIR